MIIRFNWKKLLVSLLIPLAIGGLSALITGSDMKIYEEINSPPLSPPGIVFPIAWTLLYILMGISFYLVWNTDNSYVNKQFAYLTFFVQLFLNFLWSPVFFSARQYLAAFIILVLIWIAIIAMIVSFSKISKASGLLQIPYLAWVTFAGYLNFGVYLLNR